MKNYPPPPPCGVLAPVSGGESVTTVSTAPANCPPETGWTRSEATEGGGEEKTNCRTVDTLWQ